MAVAAAQVIPATPVANAFVNLGNSPYPDATTITSGNAQPWYNSQNQAFLNLFGGNPTSQQVAAFSSTVFQRIEQTFQLSGVNVSLTTDPNAPAAHTLSLVSNTSAQMLSSAIGMTYVGGNGFSFIDQQAPAAQTLNQLEWITAHNIAHELMLAFGVGEKYDTTGNFIDARNAQWAMLTSPTASFSPAAAAALNQALANSSNNTDASPSAQVFASHPVPEPTTLALWTLTVTTVALIRSRRENRTA